MKHCSRYTKKGLTIGLVASVFLAQPIASQEQRQADRTADREQVEAMLARWEAAWNRHDMAAFAAMFHDDGVGVLWTGAVWRGRRSIEEGHAEAHRTVFRNSVQRERLEELTFVGPDAAVVRFCSTLIGDERTPDKLVRSNKFLVVSKRNGAWGIGWGQNTRLADSVPDSDCFATLRTAGGGAANPPAVPVGAVCAPNSCTSRSRPPAPRAHESR